MTSGAYHAGERHEMEFQFSQEKVNEFALVSGDDNPLHIDPDFASSSRFGHTIVHGAFLTSLISRVLGREFPGMGTIYISQKSRFLAPVACTEKVRVVLEIIEVGERGKVTLDTQILSQSGELVVKGEARVIAPKRGTAP